MRRRVFFAYVDRAIASLARQGVLAVASGTRPHGRVGQLRAWTQATVLALAATAMVLAAALSTDVDAAAVCATPGRDILPPSGVINSYWGGASASNGGGGNATITLGNQRTGIANTPFGAVAIPTTGISRGDLLVIMQMQGGTPGAYEYVSVVAPSSTTPVTSGTITVRSTGSNGGLVNAYTQAFGTGSTFQVIRVPQTLNASIAGNYSAAPWDIDASGNGTGGVFALDVAQQATLSGTIDVSGQGFRGGAGFNLAGNAGVTATTPSYGSNSTTGASKGEGTLGTPGYVFDGFATTYKQYSTTGLTSANWLAVQNTPATAAGFDGSYSAGSFGNGALGNAGGGGNDALPNGGDNQYNSGGAGGGAAGRGAQGGWTWVGNATYCESVGFTPTACPFVTNEGITDAGGRGGMAVGGLSGGLVTMGGGGGSGSVNNNGTADSITAYPPIDVAVDPTTLSGASTTYGNGAAGAISGSGARGGGIVLIRAGTFNSGAGQINANGYRAYNQFGGSEAGGGAGGGGAVVVLAQAASGTLSASAFGGRGGDSNFFSHGPGGGGGGGFVLTNFSVTGSVDKGGSGYTPNIGTPPAQYTYPNHYGSDAVDGVAGYLSAAGGTTTGASSGSACSPDVAVTVTLPASGAAGASESGSYNFINNGPSDALGVGYTATLTPGLPTTGVGAVAFGTITLNGVAVAGASANYNATTGVVTLTGLPTTLPNGQTLVVPVSFTMPANGTSVTAADAITESGVDPVPSNNTATATVAGTPTADDATSITGLPATANPSATINGTVTYQNNGPSVSNGVAYTAKLPIGATVTSIKYNGTAIAGAVATVGADGTVTFSGTALPTSLNSGDTVTLGFNATMPNNGSNATTTSGITATTTDANLSNNNATVIVVGTGVADLATSISGLPTAAQAAGTPITGTVSFQNNGPSTGITPTYTVQVPPGSSIAASAVRYNGVAINGITVTIDQFGNVTFGGTGLPTSLASGDVLTIGFSATMPANGGAANVVSSISSPTADSNLTNNNAAVVVPGIAEADAMSSITGLVVFAQAVGSPESATLTFANNGPSTSTGVAYTTTLTPGIGTVILGTPSLNGVAITGATATYNNTTGVVTYTGLPATLNPGDKITVSVNFQMPANSVTVATNISSNVLDPVPTNNAASVTVAGGSDLQATITGAATTTQASGTAETFTANFNNIGSETAPAPIYSETLTPGLGTVTFTGFTYNGTAIAGASASYNNTTGVVTFTGLPTSLNAGDKVAVVTHFTMPIPDANVNVNTSVYPSPDNDIYLGNNTATATIPGAAATTDSTVSIAGLGGVAAPNDVVSGSISYTNAGTAVATGVQYMATIPAGGTITSITIGGVAVPGASGTVSAAGVVTYTGMPTTIAAGAPVVVAFNFPMPANGSNGVVTATIASTNDSITTDNTATATEKGAPPTDLQTVVTEPVTALPSATIAGTVDFKNNGPTVASGVSYSITLPTSGGTPTINSVMLNGSLLTVTSSVAANGVVTITGLPTTLNVNDDITVAFSAKMPANGTSISTTGSITYPGADTNPANNTAVGTTVGDPTAPRVAVSKTVGQTSYAVGDTITWTLNVVNSGTGPTTGVITLTDTLPANISAVVVNPTGASCTPSAPTAGTTLTCTVPAGLVGSGGSASVQIQAKLSSTPGTYVNTVTPSGNTVDNPTCAQGACTTTTAAGLATVQVFKTSNKGVGTFGYTLTNESATTDSITTTSPGVTVGGVINTVTSQTTNVTITEGTVPAGWPANPVSATCIDTNGAASGNGATAFGTLAANVLTIPAANIKTNSTITCTFTNTVTDAYTIAKTGPTTMSVGNNATYTITITNSSATIAANAATVDDVLPAALTYVSATGLNWTCTNTGQNIACTYGGADIAPRSSSTITVTVSPNAVSAGVINYASVDPTGGTAPPTPGATCTPAADCAASASAPITSSGLKIAKSAPTPTLVANANSTYTLTVTNTNAAPAVAANIRDQLPTGLTLVSATGAGWTCTNSFGLISCSFAGAIAANGTSTIAVVVTPTSTSVGTTVVNYASIDPTGGNAPPTPGPSCAPASSCASQSSTVNGPSVAVTKTVDQANHDVGDTVLWTIRVANTGSAATTGAITLNDQLPSNISTITVTPSSGVTCAPAPVAGGTFACNVPAGLAATNGVATVTISATATAIGTLTNSVTTTGPDNPTCASTAACTASTTVGGQSLTLAKALSGNRIAGSDQFTVQIKTTSAVTASATTTGSGNTVANGSTGETPVAAGTTYTLTEIAAGTTTLSQYAASLACTNAATSSTTTLPTTVGGTVTPVAGDRISCTLTNSALAVATLTKALGGTRVHTGDQFTLQIANGATVVGSATTTGTGTSVSNSSTGVTALVAGTTYTLGEVASGTTSLAQYTGALACSNATTGSATVLPTTVGGNLTPANGDNITCTLTNTPKPPVITLLGNLTAARAANSDQFTFAISTGGSAVASATTTGTGATLNNNSTGAYTAVSGQGYTLSEAAAGTTNLNQYTSTLLCVNADSASGTTEPTSLPGNLTPNVGDNITCTVTVTPKAPVLTLVKALATARETNSDQFTVQINNGATTVASATTTGTGNTVANNSTGATPVVTGTAYTLTEIASGTTTLGQYTSSQSCVNTLAGSATVLPTTVPGTITPGDGDNITCTLTNSGNAILATTKTLTLDNGVAPGASVKDGDVLTYTINVNNSGVTAGSTVLSETVPASTTYTGTGEGWSAGCTTAGTTCTQTVAPGAGAAIAKTFTVTVAGSLSATSIANTVSSSNGTCSSCTVTTPVGAAALATTKTLQTVNGAAPGASVKAGDVLVYRLAVQNTGGSNGTTTLGETVPANTTYTGIGEGWVGPCAAAASTCTQPITVAGGATVNASFTVTVAATVSGASISNTATTSAGTCTTCTVTTATAAQLSSSKILLTDNGVAPGASVKPGDVLVYQISTQNTGGVTGATTLGETVPANTTYTGLGEGWGASCAAAGTTCSQAVSVGSGATVNKTFTVTVSAVVTGASVINTVTSSAGTCATCSVTSATVAQVATTKTLLTVNGAAPGASVKAGDVLVYQLAAQNTGGSAGTTTLGETVPANTTYTGTGEGWGAGCAAAGTTCTQAVTVNAGATVNKTFTVTVSASVTGASIANTATSSAGTCTTCTVTTPIAPATLAATKTLLTVNGAAPGASVKAGDVLVYQLATQNTGGSAGTTTLGETVPANTTYTGTGEGWGVGCAAAGTTCAQAVTVNAGATVNKTFTVTVSATVTGASIANTATSSAGTCTTCTVTTPIAAAALGTTKTLLSVNGAAPGASVKAGDVLVYQLATHNTGGSAGTTTLGETVPANTTYTGIGEGWSAGCAAAGTTCNQAVTLNAGATLNKTFTVTVSAAVSGASIANTATSSTGTCTTCTVTTPIAAAALATTKTLLTVNGLAPGASVKAGDVLVYQLATQNTGGSAGTTTLGETVPANTTYTGTGEGWSAGCAAAGTTCNQAVTLNAGATLNKTFTVTVSAAVTGASIANTATSSTGTCTTCTVTTPIAAAVLGTTKTLLSVNGAAPGASVKAGDVLVYQLATQNTGGSAGTTTLGETVPVNTTYTGTGEGWSASCAAAGTTCTQAVTLNAGATLNKTFTVTVSAAVGGVSIVNTATSSTGTCVICTVTTPIAAAALATTKTLLTVNGAAPGASVKDGDVLVYQLATHNTGGSAGTTTLGEAVPVNTTYTGTGEGWSAGCAAAGTTCNQAVTVNAGAALNKTFTVTVSAAVTGAFIANTATSSAGTCVTCTVTTPIAAATLATTKTLLTVNGAAPGASVKAGDVLVYQLSIQNTGGSAGTTTLGETVPANTTYTGTGEGWGVGCTAAGTTCAQAATVNAGVTSTKTFTVTVGAAVTGASIVNTATSSTGSCTTCTVTTPIAAAALATTKTLLSVNGAAPGASVKAGDVLIYQLSVQNTGGSAGTTTLGETVPANTTYTGIAEGWGAGCSAAGTSCTQSTTVNAGATSIKTFTVTVGAPVTGASIVNTATSSNGTCATCTVTTATAGQLTTVKTLLTVNGAAPGASTKPGDVLVYQLATQNTGGAAGTTTLGETVPANTTYTGVGEGWTASCTTAGTTCTEAITVAAGASLNKTFTVTVVAAVGATSIINTATSSTGACSSCTVTTPVSPASLATTKTLLSVNGAAPGATVKAGDVLVYQLSTQNTGGVTGTTTLGETVPANTSYTGTGEGWGGTCAAAGTTCAQAVTVNGGATMSKTFTVTIAATVTGSSIINTATSSAGTCTSCTVTSAVGAQLVTSKALLSVNGAAPGASVKAGDVLVYQLAVQNTGGTSGATTLGETVPANTTYTGTGEGWGTTCVAAGTTCTQVVTVAAGTTVDKTYTVTVSAAVTGASLANTVTTSSGTCTTCTVTTPIAAATLATTKTLLTVNGAAPGASVKAGDVLVYQLAAQNTGGSAGTTTLGETVPANTTYTGTGEGWGAGCAAAGTTCTQAVTVNAGATVNKTFTVTVSASVTGASITNTATSSAGTCTTCTVTTPIAAAALGTTKTLLSVNGAAPGATVKAGDVLVYQLATQNTGGSSGTTTLGETVPVNTTYTGTGEGWSAGCAASGTTCTQAVTLNAGATLNKTFTVTVSATATGASITNTATSSAGACTTCTVTTSIAPAALGTTKTLLSVNGAAPGASVKAGDVLVYQLATQNTGGTAGTTTLGETVPANTTYTGTGEGWGAGCAAAGTTCTQAVTLNAGATLNKTFTVTVSAAVSGASIANTATSSTGTCTTCTVTTPIAAATLATTKTLLTVNGAAPGASVKDGDVLVYQLATQNTGGSAGTTTLGETVPANTTYTGTGEGWGAGCAAAGTTCTQAVTLNAGATLNKTFTVTVSAAVSGASIANTATSSTGTCTTCTVTTPIAAAALATTKTLLTVNGAAPGASVKDGDVLVYQLATQNTGGSAGTTTLGETVPVNTTYTGTGEGWGAGCAAAGTTCTQAVTLNAGATLNKTFTVTVSAAVSGASIANTATSSAGTCTTCTVTTPIAAAALATTKTLLTVNGAAPGASVKDGDVLVYQLATHNTGGSAGTTTLGETVPANTTYTGTGEGWGAGCAAAGTTCNQAVTVNAGATLNKTFTVTVSAAVSGASIANTATSSTGTCTTCTVTTPIAAATLATTKTLLTVNGAAPGASVKAGDVLVYQLATQNTGGSAGATTLGETVPANTTYTGTGEGWSAGCAAAGTTCNQAVTLNAGATLNKTFTVTVSAAVTGASIANTATSSTGTCTTCTVTTPIAAAVLGTTKTLLSVNGAAPGATVKAGDVLVYQLATQNTGGSAGTTTLGETVPANTTYTGTGEGWGTGCAAAGTTCNQAVTLNGGATLNKTFTVTVSAAVTGASIANTATSSAGTCTTCTVSTPIAAGALATTKSLLSVNGAAPGASVKAGDVLVYQLATQNSGGSVATTTLGETVPANTTYTGTGEGWGAACVGAGTTCTQAVTVNPGATLNKTFTVKVAAAVTGASIANTATSSTGSCTTCTVTTPLAAATLATTKTLLTVNGAAPGASVKDGDVLVYQLGTQNTGGSAGTTTLGETVPANTTYTGTGEGWGAGCAAAGTTCTQAVTLNAGATLNKTFTVTVSAGVTGASIVNAATSSAGTCASCTVSTPVASATLATTKTLLTVNGAAPGASVKSGDVLVYQLATQNTGGSAGTTTLGETVPANTTYTGTGEGWGAGCAAAGTTCTQAVTVTAGTTLDKTYTVTVGAAVTGASLANTATSSNGACTACTVTTPIAAATLATTKTLLSVNGAAPGASVKDGDVLVYQLATQNTGGSAGTTTLGETVPANTTYTGTGEGWGAGCAAAGTTCTQAVALNAGASLNKTFTVTVSAAVNGASIANSATSSTGSCTTCTVTTPIATGTLATTKTLLSVNGAAPGASVKAGDILVYQLATQNTGGSAATTTLGETVPANTTYTGTGEGWGTGCAAAGTTCTQSVTLNAGTALNKTFTVTVAATVSGASIANSATSSTGGCANCTVTTPVAAGTLATAKTLLSVNGAAPGASVKAGDLLVYQLAVQNTGGSSATTTLGETVPAGSSYSGTGEGWGAACAAAGTTCTQLVAVNAGATVNKTFTVTVANPSTTTTIVNSVTSSSGSCATCTVSEPILQADLVVTLTFPTAANAGAAVSGTVKFANNGPSGATGVTYTTSLSAGLGPVTITGLPAGATASYDNTSGTVTFTNMPTTLAANAALGLITLAYTQPVSGANSVINAGISAATADPNPGNNTARATVTGTSVADLSTTFAGFPTDANAGATVNGTVSYTNGGPSSASMVTYALQLPTGLGNVLISNLPTGATATYSPGTGAVVFSGLPATLALNQSVSAIGISYPQPGSAQSQVQSTISSATTDPVTGNNTATANVGGTPEADTSVMLAFPANVAASATVSGTVTYANAGPSIASNVTYGLTLAPGLGAVTFSNLPTGATAAYNNTSGVVTFTGLGASLGVPQTLPAIGVSYVQPVSGTSTVTASIGSSVADPNTGNNTAQAQVTGTPANADLAIQMAAPATVAPDGALSYTLTISNNGPASANNATYSDVLPAALGAPTAACATLSGGAVCGPVVINGHTVTGTLPTLPTGASVIVTISTTAPASGSVTNTATVAPPAGVTDPVAANNTSSAITTVGAVPATADLSVTQSGTTTVQTNGTVTYIVDVTNGGPAAANNAVFSYNTSNVVTNVTWTCQAVGGGAVCPAASGTGNVINQTIATFPDDGHLVYTITGKAPAAAQQYANTATITPPSGITDPNIANNTANIETNVQTGAAPNADVAVTIDGPTTAQPSGPVTYTVVVNDNGPAPANGTTLSAPVPSVVTNVTTTCVATGGAVCPTVAAGNNVAPVIPTLPVGGSLTFTITGTAPTSGTFSESATVTPPTGTNDPVPANNTAGPVVTTVPSFSADLSIQKNGPAQVVANGTINYTLVVSNAGPNSANGATVTDNLPATLTNITAVCSSAAGGAVCSAPTVTGSAFSASVTTLPAAGSVTYTISAKVPASGTLSNSASVAPPVGVSDPNTANNTAGPVLTSIVATVPTQADLSATITGPSSVAPNGTVTYVVTVSNAGPAAGNGAPFTDVLPAVLHNITAVCGGAAGGAVCGPVTVNGNSVASTIAQIPAGASLTFTITATAPASGSFTNSATIGASPTATDPNLANNTAGPITTTIGAQTGTANLGISKSGPDTAGAGSTFNYVITVSNAGPGAADGALVTDVLPKGLTNVSAVCGAPTNGAVCGPVTVTGGTLSSTVTHLPALGTVTVTVTVTAPVPNGLQPTTLVNRASVTPPQGVTDPDPTDNVSGAVETAIVSSAVSGTVWLDIHHDRRLDSGDPLLPNWIVQLSRNGTVVASTTTSEQSHNAAVIATTTTNASGQYSFSGLQPGPGYSITFRDPGSKAVYGTPVNGEQGAPNPQSNAVIGDGVIQSITLQPGINIVQQSLPVDPSGVIYDAVARTAIGGATVTLIGPAGFNPATELVGGAGNVAQVTESSGPTAGAYQFLLISPGQPGGAPAGTYTIQVTPPGGYLAPPAKTGGVSLPGGTFAVPGPASATTEIQPQIGPPPVGKNGAATIYYLSFTFGAGSGSIIDNQIPLDHLAAGALTVQKTGNTSTADIGETVLYTVSVTSTVGILPGVSVTDRLPRGFTLVGGTTTINGAKAPDPKITGGGELTFAIGTLPAAQTVQLMYRVRVGVGAQEGDGVNRAQAGSTSGATSNVATFKVDVNGGVFTTDACVIGKVFVDCNGNLIQDEGELGIPGVRLYFSDGTFVITDSEGKFSYCGLRPTTHTLKVDKTTLPPGSHLVESSNRNALDPNSLFVDLKNGELHQADFIEGSCSPEVMEDVKARRTRGEVNASPSKTPAPALIFDSRPPGASRVPPVATPPAATPSAGGDK